MRTGGDGCPFCGASVASLAPRVLTALPTDRTLTRAAMVFMGATALAACGKTSGAKDPEPNDKLTAPAYGVPPIDQQIASPDAGARPQPVPPYGVPPIPPSADKDKK